MLTPPITPDELWRKPAYLLLAYLVEHGFHDLDIEDLLEQKRFGEFWKFIDYLRPRVGIRAE